VSGSDDLAIALTKFTFDALKAIERKLDPKSNLDSDCSTPEGRENQITSPNYSDVRRFSKVIGRKKSL
jgi:hypothetical protein